MSPSGVMATYSLPQPSRQLAFMGIRARHGKPFLQQDLRQAAHADSSYPNKMDRLRFLKIYLIHFLFSILLYNFVFLKNFFHQRLKVCAGFRFVSALHCEGQYISAPASQFHQTQDLLSIHILFPAGNPDPAFIVFRRPGKLQSISGVKPLNI